MPSLREGRQDVGRRDDSATSGRHPTKPDIPGYAEPCRERAQSLCGFAVADKNEDGIGVLGENTPGRLYQEAVPFYGGQSPDSTDDGGAGGNTQVLLGLGRVPADAAKIVEADTAVDDLKFIFGGYAKRKVIFFSCSVRTTILSVMRAVHRSSST